MPVTDPRVWSVDDVAAFLAELELVQYIPQIRTEKIDGSTLLECSKEDLVELGLKGVHAARLVASFKKAADAFPSTVLPPAPAPASVPPPRPSDAALCALLEKVGGTFEQAVHARELDWGNKNLNADDAKVVAYVVAVNSSLVTLSLRGNDIGAEGVTKLAAVLKETKISELNLADNALCGVKYGRGTYTAEGITKLCEGLKGSAVTSLDLKFNDLGPEGGAALAEGLKGNSTLQSLDVGFNDITGDAAENLATMVLDHASMTDFCGIPLVSLRENTITELNLESKGGGVPGAIVLSKLLPSAAAVKSLKLGGNDIRAQGASALAAVLKETKISNLELYNNNLGPKGGAALAEGLKGNSTLQSLGLEDTGLGPKGGAALAEGLKGNSVLTSLSLRLNNLTDEAKQAVKDAAGSGVQIQF